MSENFSQAEISYKHDTLSLGLTTFYSTGVTELKKWKKMLHKLLIAGFTINDVSDHRHLERVSRNSSLGMTFGWLRSPNCDGTLHNVLTHLIEIISFMCQYK
jgi:hypothetical protein